MENFDVKTRGSNKGTCAMQRAEIIFFMRPEEEKETLDLLSLFTTHPVDQAIIGTAGGFYRTGGF